MAVSSSLDLPHPPRLKDSLGPSFILLGLALGSGELIMWPYLVSQYGLGLIWGGILGITLQYFLNTEIMRYTLARGESVFVGWRRWGKAVPLWFILSTVIPWALPGFSSAAAAIATYLVPALPEKTVAITLLLITGIILGEGWLFFPPGVAIGAFLGAFAYSGAGGNLGLAQSYYIKEKGFGMGVHFPGIKALLAGGLGKTRLTGRLFRLTPTNHGRWRRWWQLVIREHLLVFYGLGLTTILLLAVLSSATARGASAEGLSFLFEEAKSIGIETFPAVGSAFLVTAALFLFATQLGVLESATRITAENLLLARFSLTQAVNPGRAFYLVLWLEIALGILLLLLGFEEPRALLTLGAILNACAMLVAFPLIFLLNRELPTLARPTFMRQFVLLFGFVCFLYFVYQTVLSTFV